jgi:hypothetical protein
MIYNWLFTHHQKLFLGNIFLINEIIVAALKITSMNERFWFVLANDIFEFSVKRKGF